MHDINNLEKNKYIKRLESREDSRKKIIVLTDKSKEVIILLKKNFEKVARNVISDIPEDEYEAFKKVLDKIEGNVDRLC